MGLGEALMEEQAFRKGLHKIPSMLDYKSPTTLEMPKVESIVMPSGGFWGGIGEPTICVAAPAVLNAFFNATGRRLRSVPLKNLGIQLV